MSVAAASHDLFKNNNNNNNNEDDNDDDDNNNNNKDNGEDNRLSIQVISTTARTEITFKYKLTGLLFKLLSI